MQRECHIGKIRWSSSGDLISDKRHWARLVSSPPVVAAKRPGAVQDQGLNPRYRRSEYPIGLRGRSVAFSPLLEMPTFLRAVKYCFCLRFSRRMVSCMKDRGPAIQRSSSPDRSFNAFLRKTQTHAQKLQREQNNAGCMPGLGSNFITVMGGLCDEARWRLPQSLSRI